MEWQDMKQEKKVQRVKRIHKKEERDREIKERVVERWRKGTRERKIWS